MELYKQFWLRCAKSVVFWIGIGWLLVTNIISFIVLEEDQDIRIIIMLLFAVGIIITNIGFLKVVPKGSGFRDAWGLFNSFMYAFIFGVGGGFIVNSLLAKVFRYSLSLDKAPYSWCIICGVAIFIGSFCIFLRFRERILRSKSQGKTQ
jgi:hypothetical protein